jgi:hypothetical protein
VLKNAYPGVRSHSIEGRVSHLLGDMTIGPSAEAAAMAFLSQHRAVFGSEQLELTESWRLPHCEGASEIFAYRQFIRGREVIGSTVRVKVDRSDAHGQPSYRVRYAGARIASEPAAGSEHPLIPGEIAVMRAKAEPGYGELIVRGEPRQVILRGGRDRPTAWTWQIILADTSAESPATHTVYVDTALGTIVHAQRNVLHWSTSDPPTTGTVSALGLELGGQWSPYTGSSSPMTMLRVPGAKVQGTVGSLSEHTFADEQGEFSLALGEEGDPITLSVFLHDLQGGYEVVELLPSALNPDPLQGNKSTSVGSHEELQLTSSQTEEVRVATATVVHTIERGLAFVERYISPSLPGLSDTLIVFPNFYASACNAGYGRSYPYNPFYPHLEGLPFLTFNRSGASHPTHGPCWHYGNHTVTAHEFGHRALDMIDPSFFDDPDQWPFHEGYADTFANMLNDFSIQGPGQYQGGANSRDDPTKAHINCQYPITGTQPGSCGCCNCDSPHNAGQLIAGVWVRMRNSFKDTYGPEDGLERARSAFGLWSLLATGVDTDCNTAHGGTYMELLGSVPRADEGFVCASFTAHNIPCPF